MPKLTKAIIEALAPGRWAWDSTLPGFGCRAQDGGRKTYVARYRTRTGRQRKLTIGRCCDLSPDQARDLARQAFAAVASGGDPAGQRQADRAAPSMADLADRYMREHAPYKKASSVVHDRRNWTRVMRAMGGMRVADVAPSDCIALHASLSSKPVTANHCRALLSKGFGLAISWGWRADNPVRGTPRFRIKPRELILSPAQLAAMDAALPPGPFADLVRLLALTGCRLNEIAAARREWVDAERRLLVLPDSKTGPRVVPLPAAAMRIIEAMPARQWLIPGRQPGRHIGHPWEAWKKLKTAAGLPPRLRIHDLRHTAGSLGHAAGLSQRQIADQLGHRDLATTARYLHGVGSAAAAAEVVAAAVTAQWHTD